MDRASRAVLSSVVRRAIGGASWYGIIERTVRIQQLVIVHGIPGRLITVDVGFPQPRSVVGASGWFTTGREWH